MQQKKKEKIRKGNKAHAPSIIADQISSWPPTDRKKKQMARMTKQRRSFITQTSQHKWQGSRSQLGGFGACQVFPLRYLFFFFTQFQGYPRQPEHLEHCSFLIGSFIFQKRVRRRSSDWTGSHQGPCCIAWPYERLLFHLAFPSRFNSGPEKPSVSNYGFYTEPSSFPENILHHKQIKICR